MQDTQPTDGAITISGAFQFAIDTFMKNALLLLAVQFTMSLPQIALSFLLPGPMGSLCSILLQSPMWGGYLTLLVALANGETVQYSDLFKKAGMFWKFLAVTVINFVAAGLGYLFLIVPGVIISIHLIFSTICVAVEGLGPIGALIRSSELTRGYRWQLFGIFAVQTVVLGILAGIFVGVPVGIISAVSHMEMKRLMEIAMPPLMVPMVICIGLILVYCYRQMVIAHGAITREA